MSCRGIPDIPSRGIPDTAWPILALKCLVDLADVTFLVIEHRPLHARHFCKLLRGLGVARVLFADEGLRALEILETGRPRVDVVVCDLVMPGMDGIAFIREIAGRRIPVALVIVSALERPLVDSVHAMAEAYGVRVLGTVERPVTVKKLEQLLGRYAGSTTAKSDDAIAACSSFAPEEIAAALRNGQFEARFQPKVRMMTGDVSGAEALVRWQHPRKGLIPPLEFMPAIEAGGFIDALTWQVARSAAENCRTWRDAGLDVNVSVNLSVLSLEDVLFADRLGDVVTEAGLESRHVFLEVTETAAARNLGRKLDNLSRLRMKGFGLSIDDYGTGYSSMYRLSRVPFSELKIDREFVRGAPMRPSNRALVESSLHLAAKLGISAVAEGVETEREWDLLRSLGCPLAQGFYIARPMRGIEFLDWGRARARFSA